MCVMGHADNVILQIYLFLCYEYGHAFLACNAHSSQQMASDALELQFTDACEPLCMC